MFPEAGQRLGPYEILGELGGGGMARVYRAWDARLHREVAIKVIDDRYAMPGIGERFLREARAASGLNHPNICTIFDIGEQDGAPYLVMELMEGETLKERIENSPMPADEILRYGAEISDALAAAHARGIVHRDIKPANIFLVKKKPTGSTQAKVLDFGLAKVEQYASGEREFGTHLTTVGATVGTVSYMSPEQARGEKLDARSDLFSLGIVMYEMATGTLPFRGATSALVFVQLLGLKAPDPIRKLNGEIPEELERLIFKLLAKSPRARFQTAVELCDELRDLSESRSGWLTRMKTPPLPMQALDASLSTVLKETNQGSNLPRIDDAGKLRNLRAEKPRPADAAERLVPARPGDPQAVRVMARKRRDSSEQRRVEHKKEGALEKPIVPDGPPNEGSGMKQARTSIATNPRVTYPAVAPYASHSGTHRATEAASRTDEDSVVPSGSGADAMAPFGISRERERAPSGMHPAINPLPASALKNAKDVPRGSPDESDFAFGGGIRWTWIALIVLVALVIAVFAAWRFGLLGGTLQTQGSLLLLAQMKRTSWLDGNRTAEEQHE